MRKPLSLTAPLIAVALVFAAGRSAPAYGTAGPQTATLAATALTPVG